MRFGGRLVQVPRESSVAEVGACPTDESVRVRECKKQVKFIK